MKQLFKLLCLTITLLATRPGYSQTDIPGLKPLTADKVALEFYKINFTKEQRKMLQQVEVELVFSLSETGQLTLEKINGLKDAAISDSISRKATRLPRFSPRLENGIPVSSVYFLTMQFPRYGATNYTRQQDFRDAIQYKQTRYEDFEYIHLSGEKVDIAFGGVGNAFAGNPGKYLAPGAGFRMGFMLTGKKGYGGGMNMSFYGNELKQDFPIASGRKQNTAPPTMLVGFSAIKNLAKKERHEFSVQLDLNYGVQNITPRLGENDQDWTQFSGFSPGIVGNYLFQFSKNKTGYYYTTPSVYNHHLNIHGAVRPVFFDNQAAKGVMLEVGISYLLRNNMVDEYRIKATPNP